MAITIKTDDRPVKVFRKDIEWNGGSFPTYSIGIGSKNKDGNWDNGYQDVKFKSGTDLANKTEITIQNAFPVVRVMKDGRSKIDWMITEYTVVNAPAAESKPAEGGWMQIPDSISEELPFN